MDQTILQPPDVWKGVWSYATKPNSHNVDPDIYITKAVKTLYFDIVNSVNMLPDSYQYTFVHIIKINIGSCNETLFKYCFLFVIIS